MSGLSGFVAKNGLDLSYIFQGGTTTQQSGSKKTGGGDLSTIFATKTFGISAANTGYLLPNTKNDLSTIYQPIIKWSRIGTTTFNLYVDGIHAYDSNNIYVSGGFTTAGGAPSNFVAMWNGTAWIAMGSGTSTPTDSLCIYAYDPSHVFVGGTFTQISGVTASHIAMWDGSSWNALGAGIPSIVKSICAYDLSHVYVGCAGSNQQFRMWDGSTWTIVGTLGGSNTNGVTAIAVYDLSNVFIGGDFTTANSITVNGFARWNGTTYLSCGSGVTGKVLTIFIYDLLHVYIGGQWSSPSTTQLAMWNGTTLASFGGSTITGGYIADIYAIDPSNVYIGGSFITPYNRITLWDGSSFKPVATGGANAPLQGMSYYNSTLYVCGSFTQIGGVSCNMVAKYAPS